MRKKIVIVISIILVSLLVYSTVQAGYLFDYGELEDHPGAGEANWMAWYRTYSDGRPFEILTEDNTNCIKGENIGYSDISEVGEEIEPEDDFLEWILQSENFSSIPTAELDEIKMLFGGLGSYSGTLWTEDFIYDDTVPYSDQGLVPLLTGDYPACPILYEPLASTPTTYTFYTEQPGTYLVYKSKNASGSGNSSNGRYSYFATVTDVSGIGSFTDDSPALGLNWYIVLQVDGNNEPIGCHSEPADPTNVRVFDFTAAFNVTDKVVELNWETASEFDILGFNVLRSTSKTGGREKLNEELLPADNPGGGAGSSYDFVDDEIAMGSTYYYWIEVIETGGGRESVGPRDVHTGYLFYIPFVK